MILNTIIILQKSLLEELPNSSQTPIWVPIAILILMVLLFLWGITRGSVKDENLPDLDDIEEH